MNEKFKELYSYVKSKGMTDLNESDFYNAYKDQGKFKDLYNFVVDDNMTDLNSSDFYNAYFKESTSQEPVKKEPVKKKDITVSSSADGSLVSQSSEPKTEIEVQPTEVESRYGDPIASKDETSIPGFVENQAKKEIKQREQQLQIDQALSKLKDKKEPVVPEDPTKIFKDAPVSQFVESEEEKLRKDIEDFGKRKMENDPFAGTFLAKNATGGTFEERKRGIQEIMNTGSEEYAVPELNKNFNKYGFTFEETGAGNFAKVSSSNNKSIEISFEGKGLDALKLMKFLDENKEESEVIKNIIAPEIQKDVYVKDEEDIKKAVSVFNNETKKFDEEVKSIVDEGTRLKEYYQKEIEQITPEELRTDKEKRDKYNLFMSQLNDLKSKESVISQKEKSFIKKGEELDRVTGEYTFMKAKQGTWAGGMRNAILDGLGGIAAGLTSFVIDASLSGIAGDEVIKQVKYGDPTYRNKYSQTAATTDLDEGLVEAARGSFTEFLGDKTTTEQWSDMQKESFWGGALLGVLESLPGMVAPGGFAGRTATMFLQVADGVNEEMSNNPEFDNVTEAEKALVSIPIGIAVGALESEGFSNMVGQKGLLNGLVARALGKSSASTTAKSFSNFIKEDVENMLARGVLTIGAGGLAEFETGTLQEVAETGIKQIYNEVKGKDMFQTPETFSEYALSLLEAGAQEAVGGMLMSSPKAVSNAVISKDVNNLPNNAFEMFQEIAKDPEYKSMYISKLKQQVISGEITPEQSKIEEDNLNKLLGIMPSIDPDLSIENQKKALELIYEKQSIESKIEGKEKPLVKKKQNRIDDINKELEALSETVAEEVEEIALDEPTEEQLIRDIDNGDVITKTYTDEKDIPDVYKEKTKVKNSIRKQGTVKIGRFGKETPIYIVTVEKSLSDYYESNKKTDEDNTVTKEVAPETVAEEVEVEEEVALDEDSIERRRKEELNRRRVPLEKVYEDLEDQGISEEDYHKKINEELTEAESFAKALEKKGLSAEEITKRVLARLFNPNNYSAKTSTFFVDTVAEMLSKGNYTLTELGRSSEQIDSIYDAELAALEGQASQSQIEVTLDEDSIEEGKKEVESISTGQVTTTKPVKIFKGIGGKKDLTGSRINAHEGVKGIFSAVDQDLANEYSGDEGVSEVVLPGGTTVEVVNIDGKGMTMSEYRQAEVDAINNSNAQVVKLVTVDGVMKSGTKKQEQYIIKDESIIKDLMPDVKTETEVTTETEADIEGLDVDVTVETETEADTKETIKEVKSGVQLLSEKFNPKQTEKISTEELDSQIDNAKVALQKEAPEVEIIVSESEAEYKKSIKEGRNQNTSGAYVDGKIYINPERANKRTVAHEVFHAVLLSKGRTNKQAQDITSRMLSAVKRNADKELIDKIDKFSSDYENSLQSEESIAELIGILAEGYPNLKAPQKNVIRKWLDTIAELFGLKKFTSDTDVINFLNTFSSKIAEGGIITSKDLRAIKDIGKKVRSIEGKSPKQVVRSVRNQKGLITLSEQEVLKYARAGIESRYDAQAIKQIGLQGVKFSKEGIQGKIKDEFDGLISKADSYIMSEDSRAVDGAIQYEIEALINDGASEAQIERAKEALKPGGLRINFINEYKKSQKETLDQWKSYLSESDYSNSFKYLILDAVLTNNYDFKTNKFTKRNSKTIRNFTPFDAGTLASLYASDSKSLLKSYVEMQGENSANIINSNSFVSTEKGEWIKFEGGPSVSDEVITENANKLSQIVQNTYWCTKTNAKSQLRGGDFYVYATKDSNGEYNSRIAVRMDGDNVREVRGNASSKQDLESEMMPVADKFLKENIPNGSGKKWLDSIEYNTKVKEFTNKIEGKKVTEEMLLEYFDVINDSDKFKVDYGENGLVTKLKKVLDKSEFDFPVARNLRELRPDTVLFIGYFRPISEVTSDLFPKYITGDADFGESKITDLGSLQTIGGDAFFGESNVTDLGSLQSIGRNAEFVESKITDLGSLQTIGGRAFFIDSKITDLGSLQTIGGDADFRYSKITDLGSLQTIGGNANFRYSKITDLGSLQTIGGDADFRESKITDLGSLQTIGGNANFRESNVTDLGSLQSIGGRAFFGDSKELKSQWNERESNSQERRQKDTRPSIDEVRKFAKENKVSDKDVREYLKQVGYSDAEIKVAMKKAPSVSKVLGKTEKKVTVNEMSALKDQIRLESKAARQSVKAYKDISKGIIANITALSKKGVITASMSKAMIKKVLSTNMMNEKMVSNLVSYIDNVFTKAGLADKINTANKRRRTALKNLRSKVGPSKELSITLRELFSIDPSLIPLSKFDKYSELLDQFGERKKVLNIEQEINEVLNNAYDILNSVEEVEVSNQETTKSKELNETIEKDLDGYLNGIVKDKIDVEKIENKDSKSLAEFFNSITKEDLEGLISKDKDGDNNYSLLENIKELKETMKNGYFPKLANDLKNTIEQNRSERELTDIVKNKVKKSFLAVGFSRAYGKIKSFFMTKQSEKNMFLQMLRGNVTTAMDDLLGNFNSTKIYDNTIGQLAKAFSRYQVEVAENVQAKLKIADSLLFRSKIPTIQRQDGKVKKSRYKIQMYRLQREFLANPDNKQVSSAIDFIDVTIKAIRDGETDIYSEEDAKILEDLKKEFSKDGQIDMKAVENNFTANEKKALKLIDEVNESIEEKYLWTANVIRGVGAKPLRNYVHHNVISNNGRAVSESESLSEKFNSFSNASTEAKTIRERTAGAKAIDFDPITSTSLGARETLLDYHMTDAYRVVKGTLKSMMKNKEDFNDYQRKAIKAIESLSNEFVENVFGEQILTNTLLDTLMREAVKVGYQNALASVPRAFSELSSNISYVIFKTRQIVKGIKTFGAFSYGSEGADAMKNLGSTEGMKLYDEASIRSRMVDNSLVNEKRRGNRATQSMFLQKLSYLSQFTGLKQTKMLTDKVSGKIISFPDLSVARPFWFGSFAVKFKELTGESLSEKDMKAIAKGDSKYLGTKYKEAVDLSSNFADSELIAMANSKNPFNSVAKNMKKSDEGLMNTYRVMNSYMASFMINEYSTGRKATLALFYKGDMTKKQAAATLAGLVSRQVIYLTILDITYKAFDSLISGEEGAVEEEEEDLVDKIFKNTLSSVASMVFTRNLGNVTTAVTNHIIERANKEYLGFLRGGEDYDPYKHSFTFNRIKERDLQTKTLSEIILGTAAGPLSPQLKGAENILKAYQNRGKSTKPKTVEKWQDYLDTRLMIEGLGGVGLLPLYKDIRRAAEKDLRKKY